MKITMVGSLPPIKGMSAYCLSLVQALSKLVKIDFINFKSIYPPIIYPIAEKEDDKVFKAKLNGNVKVDVRLKWYNPLASIWAGWRAENELLHFHWWTSFLFIVFYPLTLFAKLHGKRIICTAHNVMGHESNFIDRLLCRWQLSIPDHFIVHSENNRKQLSEHYGIKPENIEVIPHGSYDFYRDEVVDQQTAREYLHIAPETKVILFFGHIRAYKGVETLLRALPVLRKTVPDVKCIIAGKNWVPWEPYQRIIDEHGLQDLVDADLEYVASSDVKYLFSACDVVVVPYKHFESQSGPGNVALAFHKPLVVSNVGALPDLVQDDNAIFEPGNERELGAILVKVLVDASYLRKLAADSKILSQRYSWDDIAKRTVRLYEKVLDERQ